MDAMKILRARFQRDIDNIAKELIAAYSLKFEQEVEHLSSPLDRWLDFRFRFVDPQPRQVVFSDRFPKKDLPTDAQAGLRYFTRLVRQGDDINPYQGRGLTLRNDTSGNKRDARTDLLWADWGVLHFHLTSDPLPEGQYFSKSADYLAFCLVGGDMVAFIDVLRHPGKQGFANLALMETIYRNWPGYLASFQLKGILPGKEGQLTQEDVHNLRSNGVASFLTFDGKVYMAPGMGVTTASTPLKITLAADRVRDYVNALAQDVSDPEGQIRKHISELGIDQPHFSLALTPKGLAVYEEISSIAFTPPKRRREENGNWWVELKDLITPDWVIARLKQ